jgi:site-specific recombinase XerD
MKHSYSEKVIVRSETVTDDAPAQLSLRVIINQKKKEINLYAKVSPSCFDEKQQSVVIAGDAERTNFVNAVIHKAKSKARDIFTNAILNERVLTVASFVEEFANTAARNDFLAFFEKEMVKATDERAPKTIASYRATWRKLKEFRSEIAFAEISMEFVLDFERWLVKKHRLEPNTRGRHHKNLKKFIRLARKKGMKIPNPYDDWKLPSARTERDWLTVDEQHRLILLYKAGELGRELHRILRHWLFMSACSLRWSDFLELREANIGDEDISIRPQKTRQSMMKLKIPLSEFAKKLLVDARREERGVKGRIFQTSSDQNENRYLKEIAHIAGIRKNLTTVVARHTFATTFLILGGDVHVLQRIMGHSKIETTMVYVHVLASEKTAQVRNFDSIFSL